MSTAWPSEFDAFRQVHSEEILSELQVVTPKDIGRNYVLHISKNKDLDVMVPYVCMRTQKGEDRTVPRVSTSPSLAACLIGYDSSIEEWLEGKKDTDGHGQNEIPWCGGWYIYAIPFEYALLPSQKLLKAARQTDELWLVSYNKSTWSYRPRKVGKLFYTAVSHKSDGPDKKLEIDLCIELTHPGIRIPFSKGVVLDPGYYQITSDRLLDQPGLDHVVVDKMKKLTEAQYAAIKLPAAALLSFSTHGVRPEHVPSLNW